MKTFKDSIGRQWMVQVNIATVKRVRAQLDIDMLDTATFPTLANDVITLCDVLYVICQDEAVHDGITDAQFAMGFSGAVLREAHRALMEAYTDFFPDPELQKRLRIMDEKNKVVREKALALLEKKTPQVIKGIDKEIESFLTELEADMDKAIETGNTSTNVQASSASTRHRSRSAK